MLSVLRVVAALLFLQHGLSKYFAFPGPSPAGFHVISLLGLAALIETLGSLLLLFGLFTRPAAFIMSGEMAFAYFTAHQPRALFPIQNGGELAILLCFVFLYLAVAGGGTWSLDAQRRRR